MEYSTYLLYFLGIHTRLKAPSPVSIVYHLKLKHCIICNQGSILAHIIIMIIIIIIIIIFIS